MTRAFKDVSGTLFGRLTAKELVGFIPAPRGKRMAVWRCECTCGQFKEVPLLRLTSGNTQSCGCLFIETVTTHGQSDSPAHRSWRQMKDRCSNPNNPRWERYGGRGISVCARWVDSFENFLEDMGVRPDGKSLDRRNNDLNYFPENCRWATPPQQNRNTSRNRLLTIGGVTKTLIDWCEEKGMEPTTITTRLARGWSNDAAVNTPPDPRFRSVVAPEPQD